MNVIRNILRYQLAMDGVIYLLQMNYLSLIFRTLHSKN